MKILHLCKKPPYPIHSGEALAVHYLGQGLIKAGVNMDILVMDTAKDPIDRASLHKHIKSYRQLHIVDVDNRIKAIGALKALIQNKSYHISRFDTPAYRLKIIELLEKEQYDAIILETLYTTPYINTIRANTTCPIIYRSHNIEHLIWQRNIKELKPSLKRWYLKKLVEQLKKYELNDIKKYDLILPISPIDNTIYQNHNAPLTLDFPIGVDIEKYKVRPLPTTYDLYFIGSLDWTPNVEGLKWFISEIWPSIYKKYGYNLHIAGRNASNSLIEKLRQPGIIFHGEVEDAIEYHNAHHTMIVPLHSGSGMRVKIIEAMALGKPIISTKIGAEGLDIREGKELILAEDLASFTLAIEETMVPINASNLREMGIQKIINAYEYKKLGQKLLAFIKEKFN